MKVFIIDDEEISLYIAQRKLHFTGIAKKEDIHSFINATEAYEVLSASREEDLPDIILLDLGMPHMDGWQFLDALNDAGLFIISKCRIYVLTTSINKTDEVKAENHPLIAGLIVKPINDENIKVLNFGRTG